MFVQLNQLLASCVSITLSMVANDDGTLSVTVVPKAKKDSEDAVALKTPLQLTATPEELDAEFVGMLVSYTNKRKSLSEQLEETEAVLEAAKKNSAAKAVKAVKKGAGSGSPKQESPGVGHQGDIDPDDGEVGGAESEEKSSEAAQPASAANLWD